MQNTETPNHHWLLYIRTHQYDFRRPPWEVRPTYIACPLFQFPNGIVPPLLTMHLHVGSSTGCNILLCGGHLAKAHDPIDQAMNDFESARRTRVRRTHPPRISRPHDRLRNNILVVGKDHVANLEQLEPPRERRGFVVLQTLQQSRKKRCAHHLVLDVGGIAQAHRRGDGSSQCREVIVGAAQSVGEDLDVARPANLLAEQIPELIQRLFPSHGASLRDGFDDVVVTVSDANVLGDVYGVEDVRAGGGDGDFQKRSFVLVGGGEDSGGPELDLIAERRHGLRIDVYADDAVDHFDAGGFLTGVHLRADVRIDNLLRVVDVVDRDRFDGEGHSCILGKHGHNRIQNDVRLGHIRGRAFDEDVLGIEGNATLTPVDDGWQR
mmetsp:Transcript_13657/g.29547  ORF Transcript_13657/g.29547 Transcript_13657/m.29547 type:complete len:379 (+) Transcript_13657:308-1444(+)